LAFFVTIPVGRSPHYVAVSPSGDRLYVTNFGSETVSVIDTNTLMVIRSPITFGSGPLGVAVTPNGARVYVSNHMSDNVSVIDTATNAVVATIPVGLGPYGVAATPNGAQVYVANLDSDDVSVIDTATNAVVRTIPAPAQPNVLAVTPDGGRVYVAHFFGGPLGGLSMIDTATNMVTTIPVGSGPDHTGNTGIAVAPNGGQVYLANTNITEPVSVIATASNSVVATIPGVRPQEVAIDPNGKHLYVTNSDLQGGSPDANTVSVIDTTSNAVVATLYPGGERPHGLAATATNVYVAHVGSAFVSVIDI
jgi:YVTN family beta-propeller protein